MDPVHRALSVALRRAVSAREQEAAPMPPLEGAGWEALADRILEHRLAVSLAADAPAWGMPEAPARRLAEAARLQQMRTQWLMLELHRVISTLQQADMRPIVLKGAALVHTLHAPRFFVDLDVLVPRPCLDRATRAVEVLGYGPVTSGRSHLYYERHHFHRVLRSEQGVTLELHWDLARPSDYFHVDAEGLRARARTLPFHDIELSVPSHSDQLLHAAEQSLRDGFREARRVIDVARLLVLGAAKEAGLAKRAAECRLSSALWLLLRITESLTGVGGGDLTRELTPTPLRQASLQSLDPPALLLERRADRLAGLASWLWLVCAPNAALTAKAFAGTVFPGERGILEDGHLPESAPGPVRRGVLSLKRMGRAAKLAGYQTWKLGPHLTWRRTRHT